MDNLNSHKSAAAVQSLERVGATAAYLPPYSPELNPIGNIFSKIKQIVRRIKPRSFDKLIDAIAEAINAVKMHEICNAFEHAGYAITN